MTRRVALIGAFIGVFMLVVVALVAISLTIEARNSSNISTLLLNGKTSSAINAKATKQATVKIKAIVEIIETDLNQIISRSNVTHELICGIATATQISNPTIAKDCS